MTDLRTAAQMALDALEQLQGGCTDSNDGTVEAITVWCPEVIDALRAALSAPPGWQPIETAPKDGPVLLWGRYWSDGQGWFQRPMAGRWQPFHGRWEIDAEFRFGVRPTHWMPLPNPPAAPSPQEQQI